VPIAGTAKKSSSSAAKPHAHTGPFSSFTKSLAQEKKRPFMELMKKLRGAKQATGTKDDKKKTTTGLDSEIHKLLGPEYKRYRAVSATVKEIHHEKKAAATGTATAVAAKPTPVAAAPPPKPVSILKKIGGKKKKPSTTV